MRSISQHKLTVLLATLGAGIVLALLGWGLTINPNKAPNALVGRQAPEFEALLLQGDQDFGISTAQTGEYLNLSQLRGRELVLNFWASWCVSCREEALILENFWKQHRSEGVVVVGIAIQDEASAAQAFAKHFGKTYILAVDEAGSTPIHYGVTGVPETYFIRKDGTILDKYAGPLTPELLEKYLAEMRGAPRQG
ncbi:MAG: TlpA disulfide reductase family protein [Zetaproteobacteria bacterium]|nr:TlpA disulfide reductase family protein [Zetaproteobacteria bacterium]